MTMCCSIPVHLLRQYLYVAKAHVFLYMHHEVADLIQILNLAESILFNCDTDLLLKLLGVSCDVFKVFHYKGSHGPF